MFSIKVWFLTIIVLTTNAHARDLEFGEADESTVELAQFEYFRGQWDVEIAVKQDDGSFKVSKDKATVKGYYHTDGKTFQSIFTTSNGAFTTDIRSYNIEKDKWQVMFMNAKAQRWHSFEAGLENGNMVTNVTGGYSGKEKFDIKIIDKDVSRNKFTKEVYRSYDNGEKWQKIYIMNYKRKA